MALPRSRIPAGHQRSIADLVVLVVFIALFVLLRLTTRMPTKTLRRLSGVFMLAAVELHCGCCPRHCAGYILLAAKATGLRPR